MLDMETEKLLKELMHDLEKWVKRLDGMDCDGITEPLEEIIYLIDFSR